ncbi:MAG: cache domain-containing protein [Smithellaceae bacterium]
MKNRSLRFKMMAGGLIAVFIPILVIGALSIYRASTALENVSKSQSLEVAKSLANMANLAVKEEMKIVAQTAQRDIVISAAVKYAEGALDAPEIAQATAELTALVKRSGTDYEAFIIVGLDGKILADGRDGQTKGMDLSDRDYVQAAKAGRLNTGSVTKSRNSGNIVLTFGAPVYSGSNQIIGVVASIININFLSDNIASATLGKTGYAFVIDKTGLIIAHPNKDLIVSLNITQEEGMKDFSARMVISNINSKKAIVYFHRSNQKFATTSDITKPKARRKLGLPLMRAPR